MTKEEFEKGYCERSGITIEFYNKYKVTLPCACGEEDCEGWAAMSNDPELIKWHMQFYAPKKEGV